MVQNEKLKSAVKFKLEVKILYDNISTCAVENWPKVAQNVVQLPWIHVLY